MFFSNKEEKKKKYIASHRNTLRTGVLWDSGAEPTLKYKK